MRKIMSLIILAAFLTNSFVPLSYAQMMALPVPGTAVAMSAAHVPCALRGMRFYPGQPLKVDFIVDPGESGLGAGSDDEALRLESGRQIKYFLASLTTPKQDLWVNLSPYEKERIIPESFGTTELGRDLLAQDYLLKQVTATALAPDGRIGKEFWRRVYAAAQAKFGTTSIPVDSFHKVWIVPGVADVYVKDNAVYITKASLKLMLASDYEAANNSGAARTTDPSHVEDASRAIPDDISTGIMREVVLPELEREVNEGANFGLVRQAYHALILAAWFKGKVAQVRQSSATEDMHASPLGAYIDRNKTAGIAIDDINESRKIWAQYVQSVQRGVYNFIREEKDPYSGDVLPRKYFSGGADYSQLSDVIREVPSIPGDIPGSVVLVRTDLRPLAVDYDFHAMNNVVSSHLFEDTTESHLFIMDIMLNERGWNIPAGGTVVIAGPRDNSLEVEMVQARVAGRKVVAVEYVAATAAKLKQELEKRIAVLRKAGRQDRLSGEIRVIESDIVNVPVEEVPLESVQFFYSMGMAMGGAVDEDFGRELGQKIVGMLTGDGVAFLQYRSTELLKVLKAAGEVYELKGDIILFKKTDSAMLNIYKSPVFAHALGAQDVDSKAYVKLDVAEVGAPDEKELMAELDHLKPALPEVQKKWDGMHRWLEGHAPDQKMVVVRDPEGVLVGALVWGLASDERLIIYSLATRDDRYHFLHSQIVAWVLNQHRRDKEVRYYTGEDFRDPVISTLYSKTHRIDVDFLRLEMDFVGALHEDEWKSPSAMKMLMDIRGLARHRITPGDRELAGKAYQMFYGVYEKLKAVRDADDESSVHAITDLERSIMGASPDDDVAADAEVLPFRERLIGLFPAVHDIDWRRPVPDEQRFEAALGMLFLEAHVMRDGVRPEQWLLNAYNGRIKKVSGWLDPSSQEGTRKVIQTFSHQKVTNYWDLPNTIGIIAMSAQLMALGREDETALSRRFYESVLNLMYDMDELIFPFLKYLIAADSEYADIYADHRGKAFMAPWPSMLKEAPEVLTATRPADQIKGIYDQAELTDSIMVRNQISGAYERLRAVDMRDRRAPVDKRSIFAQMKRAYKGTEWKWRFVQDWFNTPGSPDKFFVAVDDDGVVHAAEMVSFSGDGALSLDVWMQFSQDYDLLDSQFVAWTLAHMKKEASHPIQYFRGKYFDNPNLDQADKLYPLDVDQRRLENRLLAALRQDAGSSNAARDLLKQFDAAARNLGGIDFNTDGVRLNEKGAPFTLPVSAGSVGADALQGFTPVIIGVLPAADVRVLFN
ncbi:MAG: hypothetical protein HQL17_00285 [Candidatus Omnitrophica bacterium]|nr:hypothetical protein [Candidatus Omnitrophota bacterium]